MGLEQGTRIGTRRQPEKQDDNPYIAQRPYDERAHRVALRGDLFFELHKNPLIASPEEVQWGENNFVIFGAAQGISERKNGDRGPGRPSNGTSVISIANGQAGVDEPMGKFRLLAIGELVKKKLLSPDVTFIVPSNGMDPKKGVDWGAPTVAFLEKRVGLTGVVKKYGSRDTIGESAVLLEEMHKQNLTHVVVITDGLQIMRQELTTMAHVFVHGNPPIWAVERFEHSMQLIVDHPLWNVFANKGNIAQLKVYVQSLSSLTPEKQKAQLRMLDLLCTIAQNPGAYYPNDPEKFSEVAQRLMLHTNNNHWRDHVTPEVVNHIQASGAKIVYVLAEHVFASLRPESTTFMSRWIQQPNILMTAASNLKGAYDMANGWYYHPDPEKKRRAETTIIETGEYQVASV